MLTLRSGNILWNVVGCWLSIYEWNSISLKLLKDSPPSVPDVLQLVQVPPCLYTPYITGTTVLSRLNSDFERDSTTWCGYKTCILLMNFAVVGWRLYIHSKDLICRWMLYWDGITNIHIEHMWSNENCNVVGSQHQQWHFSISLLLCPYGITKGDFKLRALWHPHWTVAT